MKKHILPLLSLFMILLIISSCKKETNISNERRSVEETKFFTRPQQLDTFVRQIVDTVWAQNQKEKFVDNLAKEIGYPLWEQSEVVLPTALIPNVQVIVPFVLPAQKEVNSFLVCNIYDSDISFHLVKGASYSNYGFNRGQNVFNAGTIAQVLMYFDYKIFGDSLFLVNDPGILNASTNVASRTTPATTNNNVIKITPQPLEPTPIHMIPKCADGVTVKYTSVNNESPDPFGSDPCTIWVTTSAPPAFNTDVPPGGGGGGTGSTPGPQPIWNSKPSCIKVIGGKVYFDVPGCTTIPPITAMTDDIIITNKLSLLTTKERQIWDEIYKEEKEADEVFNKDCQGTNRTGNIQWPGTIEHWMIMIDYIVQNPLSGEIEYQIPGGSAAGNRGYADIVNKASREIFEIKPNNKDGIDQGKLEVSNYVIKANANCPPAIINDGGSISPWVKGTTYTKRTIPNPKDPLNNIIAELNSPGVIVYSSQSGTTQPVPIVIPQSVLDKLKNLIKKLKEKVDDYETAIAMFLRENPDLANYIKTAAYSAAVTIIVATIVEDFVTLGAGIADDWASFLLAYRIMRFASIL